MVSKMLRRQLQALVFVAIALSLLATSAVITLFGFSAWHILSTRPYHEVPLSFNSVPAVDSKRATVEAVVDLRHRRLHSVDNMESIITLSLPESDTNFENSVFQVSSYLLSSDEICVAHSSSTATLRFRSPAHRAARAVMLFVPMLLGLTREYQTVSKPLFRYKATRRKGILPRLQTARIKIHTGALQIESAELILRAGRTGLLTAMLKEGWLSTLSAITVGIWYCMLCSLALMLACVSATRRAIFKLFDAVVGRERGLVRPETTTAPRLQSKGSPPRQILLGHGEGMNDAEIGKRWASVNGYS